MRRALTILILLAGLAARPSGAVEVRSLYEGQAVVTGTEEPERTRGFSAALVEVVVKLTGDARLAGDARIEALAEAPHPYVAAFGYEDRMKGIPVHDEQGTRERPYDLTVRFDPEKIDAALAGLGLRKWRADRPVLAVWLAVRTARGAYVLAASGDDGYGQRAVLTETARRRGQPLRLPAAGDPVAVADVEAGAIQTFREAEPDAAAHLYGLLSTTPDGYWRIAWTLADADGAERWRLDDVTFDHALKDGLARAALRMSGRTQR